MKVMCINDDFSNRAYSMLWNVINETPKERKVYTVRQQVMINGKLGYEIEEIFGGVSYSGLPIVWDANRFLVVMENSLHMKECMVEEDLDFNIKQFQWN